MLVAVGALGITLMLSALSFFSFIELKGLDLLFALRGPLPPPEEIVIVAIDEPSMAELRHPWPWPRRLHAQLIEKLQQAGAKVIGIDILFAEPSTPDNDQALLRAVENANHVVLVSVLSRIDDPLFRHSAWIHPLQALRNAAVVGHPRVSLDLDGVARRTRLMSMDMPSFALQTFRSFLGEVETLALTELRSFDTPTLLQDQLINYRGPARTIKTVSYYQALDYATLLPPGLFSGKIVLIGQSLEGTAQAQNLDSDLFLTPFSWTSGTLSSGVELQATIISNLLHGDFIQPLTLEQRGLLLLALALLFSGFFAWLNPLAAPFSALLGSGLILALAEWSFAKAGVWLPLFSIISLLVLTYSGHLLVRTPLAERERRQLLEKVNRELERKVTERTQELLNTHQELSERHRLLEAAYQELGNAQQQLIQSEKMASLGMLVAGIAHELNNPISYVHSNLEFIQDYVERLAGVVSTPAAPPEPWNDTPSRRNAHLETTLQTLRELIASCQEGSMRVKKIVLDLRTFSRIDDPGLAPTDVHDSLESTLNLLNSQYGERITLHRDYGVLPVIECYPSQLNQVLMNLLQNAAQAIPERGDVWIRTRAHETCIEIAIRDNGPGIAEAHFDRIFDPFFTTKAVGAGTGLGLSISYGIIHKHGGTLRVNRQLREGAEFIIELPIHSRKNSDEPS